MKIITVIFLSVFTIVNYYSLDKEETQNNTTDSFFSKENPCDIVNTAFHAGEEIEYKMYYNWGFIWISAGKVRFTVSESEENYLIEAIGYTHKSYEWAFSLHDTFSTVINKKTMLPQYSTRKIHEGKYHLYEGVTYDHELGIVNVERGKNKNKTSVKSHPISNCTQDVLSSIYFLRNTNTTILKEQKNIEFNMFLESKVYNLNLRFKGKSKTKISKEGKVHSIEISPQLLSGNVFKDKDEMKVWVSDDQNHLPVLIESPIAVGSIKALLIAHTGLRHPLNWVN